MSRRRKTDGKAKKSRKPTCKQTGRKDGRLWTTSPEEVYLRNNLPGFEEAKKARDFSNFWPPLYQGYWDLFPVPPAKPADLLSDEESEDMYESDAPMDSPEEDAFMQTERGQLRAAEKAVRDKERSLQREKRKALSPQERYEGRFIQKRRKQIYTWMHRHCSAGPTALRKRSAISIIPVVGASATAEVSTRVNQEDEAYLHLFKHRVMPVVEERTLQGSCKGPQINIIRQVAREQYKSADEDTRAAVAAELGLQTEHKVEEQVRKKAFTLTAAAEQKPPTPQQYQDAIHALPQWAEAMLKGACDSTGFVGTLIIGGPLPERNGEITTISCHVGKNAHGNTFAKAYQKYQAAVIKPYTEFLRSVFPTEVREGRALKASPTTSIPVEKQLEGAAYTFDNSTEDVPVPSITPELRTPVKPTRAPSPFSPDIGISTRLPPVAAPVVTLSSPERATSSIIEPQYSLPPPIPRLAEESASLPGAASPSPRLSRIAQKASSPTELRGAGGAATPPPPPPRPKPRPAFNVAFKAALLARANEEAVDAAMPDTMDPLGNSPKPSLIIPPTAALSPPSSSESDLRVACTVFPHTVNVASPASPSTARETESPAALAANIVGVDVAPVACPPAPVNTGPPKRKKQVPVSASPPAKRAKRTINQSRTAKDIAQQEAEKAAEVAAKAANKIAKAAAKEAKVAAKASGKGNTSASNRGGKKGQAAS
ncbi:hypothetical protein HWV62_45282 [Athelia sp. TMB]|nr:hypothetical protein HWV62_45282 [Athelia sp. TMB]